MKKKFRILLSLLLCFIMLCGCAAPATVLEMDEESEADMPRFDELEYVRPDIEAFRTACNKLSMALSNPFRPNRVFRLLVEASEHFIEYDNMLLVAYIRSCKDLSDEFYAEEYSWLIENEAEAQSLIDGVYNDCANSIHRFWLERFVFWDGFSDEYGGELGEGYDSDYERYIELSQEEARLIGEYRQQCAFPTIFVDGKEQNIDEYMADCTYDEYIAAYNMYYEKYNPILGGIYVELIGIRQQQAELLGYDSYAELCYELDYGRDYSPDESEAFLSRVKKHIAPLGESISENEIKYDFVYRLMDADELRQILQSVAESYGQSIEEAYELMIKYGLYDFEVSPNKDFSSFVVWLSNYEAPYFFLSPYGDIEDLVTLFHEFGHYANSYIRNGEPETNDLSECFSNAMQLLAMSQLESELSRSELEQLVKMNMLDMLDSYLSQSVYAEFELRAYEMDEPSIEKLNELFLGLSKEYSLYEEYGEESSLYSWVDISHLYESPFYVLSYPVSAGVALELYEMELEREGAGMDKFIEMSISALPGLEETLDYAELQDPMSEKRISAVAKLLKEGLK